MALTTSTANTISHEVFGKDFKENVYDSSPFLKLLKDNHKVVIQGGNSLTWPVEYKQLGTAASRDWNDQVVYESVDTWTQAALDWAHIDAQVLITKEEKLKNQDGPNQIVNIIKAKEKALRKDLSEQMSDQIFATSGTTNYIRPLAEIVDSASSYAGIAVADASAWAGIEDSSSTQITRALLYTNVASATFGEDGPSVHFTTRAMLAYYNALLGADERYHNTKTANAGFKTITLYGDNVYADGHVPSGYWFGLDLGAFELWVMDGADMSPTDWFDLQVAGYPKAIAKYVDVACNLVNYRRRTSFKLSALTGT